MTDVSTNRTALVPTGRKRRARPAVFRGKRGDFLVWLASAVALVVAWQWYVTAFRVSPAIFPAPVAVGRDLYINIADGTFIRDLKITLTEVLIGFAGGSTVGFLLALAISEFRPVRIVVYPYVVALQSIPKSALAPLFLIWFGFGMESKIALVIVAVFFPVLTNTLAGIERADPDQLDLMRAFCAKRWKVFWRVKLPTALPPLFAGLQLGIVLSMIAAVVSEFLGSVGGLGYRILMFNTNLDMSGQFAAIIVLSVTGFTLHATVKYIGRRVVFWGRQRETDDH